MAKANTRPLSGMRDFLPLDVLRRRYVIGIIEQVYQSHGFEPLETPALERLETLLGKYGEEGDQLIFRILKRGAKLERALEAGSGSDRLADAGLRYDLTVPLARVAAQHGNDLPRYFKRYQIQPVYRADRPARGRFREFFQCDLDIVGSRSPLVEVEILDAAAAVYTQLGFEPDSFSIRLNHRAVLGGLLEAADVATDLEAAALAAIDKLDKIGMDGVAAELEQRGIGSASRRSLKEMIASVPENADVRLDWLQQRLAPTPTGSAPRDELARILELSRGGAAADHLEIDPFLARGLSYYTGPIFEIAVEGFPGSAGGGGRYDDLIGMFAGRTLPASGFSLGLERVLLIMEERVLFPKKLQGQPQVLVTLHSEELADAALQLARLLRAEGLRVDLSPEPAGGYGRQFQYADQRGIRLAVLCGPDEHAAGQASIKDLETGDQSTVDRAELASELAHRLVDPAT